MGKILDNQSTIIDNQHKYLNHFEDMVDDVADIAHSLCPATPAPLSASSALAGSASAPPGSSALTAMPSCDPAAPSFPRGQKRSHGDSDTASPEASRVPALLQRMTNPPSVDASPVCTPPVKRNKPSARAKGKQHERSLDGVFLNQRSASSSLCITTFHDDIACSPSPCVPTMPSSSAPPCTPTFDDIVIVSRNMNGTLIKNLARPEFRRIFDRLDVFLVQETHLRPDQRDMVRNIPGFDTFVISHPMPVGHNTAGGVTAFASQKMSQASKRVTHGLEGAQTLGRPLRSERCLLRGMGDPQPTSNC
ncbi:hypothetical protein GGX14DRAFT_587402 [Mycena pura]|uniref:Endonuclease/exonuclease/phosphatase domain-containing protein n=1 Tax=Mycena pura TaxID=153505 RepID=A0AAD6UX49_9AGAR|nr:hypothetical protein GGX14DRAFT_587402 [Mycena pura]